MTIEIAEKKIAVLRAALIAQAQRHDNLCPALRTDALCRCDARSASLALLHAELVEAEAEGLVKVS